jgi:uncharacterized membrane protein YkoI
MKNVLFVVCVALLLGCSGQAPESEKSVTADGDRGEAIFVEDFEDGGDKELEVPSEDSLPWSEILAKLEAVGYTQIVDAELEDGVWEVEYVVDGEEHELHVDPMTGEILPEETQEADKD